MLEKLKKKQEAKISLDLDLQYQCIPGLVLNTEKRQDSHHCRVVKQGLCKIHVLRGKKLAVHEKSSITAVIHELIA